MESAKVGIFLVILFCCLPELYGQGRDLPRGPWQLAFKVVSGKWDNAVYGTTSFWELFTSTKTYSSVNLARDKRDFTSASDHFKSNLVEDWQNKLISVQAIKLSFFKDNKERAYVVFGGVDKTKATWFQCTNILYSSYTDLGADNSLGQQCPGSSIVSGFPLTIMKDSYWSTQCSLTTAWTLVVDVNVGFSVCSGYAPADGSIPKPYFKYSKLPTVAGDLSTNMEQADSIGIFFQVWDMVFKGIEAIKPLDTSLIGLTGLYESDSTENDKSGTGVRNLIHDQSSKTFKSGVINSWEDYHIDTVKFSLLKSGQEKAYVVFNGVNTNSMTWFSKTNLLYSSYGNDLDDATLAVCSIEGDLNRNWQIQSVAVEGSCSLSDQRGWMLVKDPRNNGTCEWDISRKKPYFLYNTGTAAANPSFFHYADVMAVFVQGWRIVYKVTAGGSVTPATSLHALWTQAGALHEANKDAMGLAAGSPSYKSSVIDGWDTEYVHAVKLAAYKNDQEVFYAVFDATGSSNMDWLDCNRLLYTSVSGLDRTTAKSSGYTCSFAGEGVFRMFLGKGATCNTVSATGVFAVVDTDSTCSHRTDLPQFLYSNTMDGALSESSEAQLADTLAIFVDMDNCYNGLCKNGGTCQDIAGNFRCFCTGNFYGQTCANLDGLWSSWKAWSPCSVTCGDGVSVRIRSCEGAQGEGMCEGEGEQEQPCSFDPCRVDGGYSAWTAWSECSQTCGTGNQTRSRDCTNPAPQNGGADCIGDSEETQDCNTHPCPIDGGLTEWTDWGQCTQTCGTGSQSRSRDCTNPAPLHGGADCQGDLVELKECNMSPCPIDGGFTEWSDWLECSKTCGTGSQSRSRDCTNPAPLHGGTDCVGEGNETQDCNTDPCPVNGHYTEWTGWGDCSKTCGTGTRSRSRDCTNPAPQHGGENCVGESIQHEDCNSNICPIDGGFTEWTEWGICTQTCGAGHQSRSRDCERPVPQYGGADCVGDSLESQTCTIYPCPIDGGFSEWTEWEECTRTCGSGDQCRSRDCTNPAPQYGGQDCIGEDLDTQLCNTFPCPIDGVFGGWTEWGTCTQTCGTGNQSRSRECTDPAPEHGGRDCIGDRLEYADCNINPCPVDGNFTEWTIWGTCTQTCGTGSQSRARDCTNPAPQYGGDDCIGDSFQIRECNSYPCPIDGRYTEWTVWGECTRTCGTGSQSRSRDCTNPVPKYGGLACVGKSLDSRKCSTDPCPIDGAYSAWTGWGLCTHICGWGIQLRSRGCTNPTPQHGGAGCEGESVQVQNCNLGPCRIDGAWALWTQWSPCSNSCGKGNQTRSRECNNPAPNHGGSDCVGEDSQVITCNDIPCPVDGVWSDWSDWTTCTVSCGGGTHERTRACDGPYHGGKPCEGQIHNTQACETDPCPPVDGVWSAWSEWSTCSKTCGDGIQVRVRNCTKPQHGGKDCSGNSLESVICKLDKCPVNGAWSQWTAWSTCTETCGGGIRGRTRTCSPPLYGGLPCQGHPSEVSACNAEACPPVHGGWTEWTDWSTCTKTCGVGDQRRSRTCTNPEPDWGGEFCQGNHGEFRYCNEFECPIDGGWSDWSQWTACMNMTHSKCDKNCSCGKGRKSHHRLCDKPAPKYEGKECPGDSFGFKACNIPCADFQCDPNNPENCKVWNQNGGDMQRPTTFFWVAMTTLTVLIIIL